jgi:uncharacterized protein YegP (UPF0339 family)
MFEIFKSEKNGQFYFRLKAANGLAILASEGSKAKAACKNGIASVKMNAANESAFTLKTAKNGKVFFTMDAKNGNVIGSSQMYAATSGRKKGIASVQKNAPDAEIKDLT